MRLPCGPRPALAHHSPLESQDPSEINPCGVTSKLPKDLQPQAMHSP